MLTRAKGEDATRFLVKATSYLPELLSGHTFAKILQRGGALWLGSAEAPPSLLHIAKFQQYTQLLHVFCT